MILSSLLLNQIKVVEKKDLTKHTNTRLSSISKTLVFKFKVVIKFKVKSGTRLRITCVVILVCINETELIFHCALYNLQTSHHRKSFLLNCDLFCDMIYIYIYNNELILCPVAA